MRTEYAEQYGTCCLVLDGTEDFNIVLERAYYNEAVYHDGEDNCIVARFPERPPELYTEEAMRRSLAK